MTVTKHHVYHGAQAGSLENVWFGIKYTDGSTTGKGGAVEAPTPLLETAEGRAALLRSTVREDEEGPVGGQVCAERVVRA